MPESLRETEPQESGTREAGPYRVGDRLHGYEIVGRLGRGGFAWVYAGKHELFGTEVAIKVIPREDDKLARRARAEAKLLKELDHPNLVKVHDAGVTESGAIFIVMELLRGETLRDTLRRERRLEILRALRIFIQIANGVQAAHERAAIHRDLKPENVFLLGDGTVKVLDFGIAKFLGAPPITGKKDRLQGTLPYMSPEHLQGRVVTPRSDIFAIGTMLFEALHRHPLLLGGEAPVFPEIVWRQMLMPPRLDTLDPHIPERVARTVERAIARIAGERFASARELSEALASARAWLESTSYAARRPERVLLCGAPDGQTEPELPRAFSGTVATVRGIGPIPSAALPSEPDVLRVETEQLSDGAIDALSRAAGFSDSLLPPARATRSQPRLSAPPRTPLQTVLRAAPPPRFLALRPWRRAVLGALPPWYWITLAPLAILLGVALAPSLPRRAEPEARPIAGQRVSPSRAALAPPPVPVPSATPPSHTPQDVLVGVTGSAPRRVIPPKKSSAKPSKTSEERRAPPEQSARSASERRLRWLIEELRAEEEIWKKRKAASPPAQPSAAREAADRPWLAP